MCVYETGLLLLFAYIGYRTSAASVELLPRGSRAVAFPLWLQVLTSKLLDVAHCLLFIVASTLPLVSCVLASLAPVLHNT